MSFFDSGELTMSLVQKSSMIAENASTASPELIPFLLSTDAFYQMIEAEIFRREDRVELWDGRIYEKMAKKVPHTNTSMILPGTLNPVLPAGWFLMSENPITLGPRRSPLPDYCVLRGTPKDYLGRYAAADVGLIIELSESSLRTDTGIKLGNYAEASIPAYWVINLVKNVIQTYETPIPPERRYESAQTYAVGQAVPLRLDGVLVAEIPALDLLPVRG